MSKLVKVALLCLLALVAVGSGSFPESGHAVAQDDSHIRWYGRFHHHADASSFADHVVALGARHAAVTHRDRAGVYYVYVAWPAGWRNTAVIPWNGHQVHGVTHDPRQ